MKKILFILLLALTIASSYAQIPLESSCSVYAGFVTTPNGTHVPTANKNASKKLLLMLGNREYNLSTRKNLSFGLVDTYYNCYGFAWHMVGCQQYKSGSQYNYENPLMSEAVWINEPYEEIYFSPDDGSYIENPFVKSPIGAMVHYGELDDHTAVSTKTPNKYISKNGDNPIVYHTGTSFANYDGEDTQIYIRADYENLYDFWEDEVPAEMLINGPASIAYGSNATYSISNLPSGATVSWLANPSHLVNISTNGNNAIVSPNFNSTNSFTLYASVSGASNPPPKSVSITSNITNVAINGPDKVCSSGTSYSLSPNPTGVSISWNVNGNLSVSGSTTGSSLIVNPSGAGTGTIRVYINGSLKDTKTVWAGKPLQATGVFPLNNNGNNEFCSNRTYNLSIMDDNPSAANITSYTWGFGGIIHSGAGSSTIVAQFDGGDVLSVRANNQCGGGTWLHIPYTILPVYYCQGGGELFCMSPNPANEVVNITFNASEEVARTASTEELSYTIRIYDQYSHFIKKIKCNTEDVSIDISFLDPGIYYLQIEYNGAKFAQTLLVE